jgi:hypothetical protein
MPRNHTGDASRSRAGRLADLINQLVDQGLTQRQIAESLNVPPNYLSDLKRGQRDVTDTFARHFALVYGVDVTWLLTGEGEAPRIKLAAAGVAPATTLCRPLLTTPHVGDPRTAPGWDGSLFEVSGRAAAEAGRASHAYILRASANDQRGRILSNDLLLVSQSALIAIPDDALAIVRHRHQLRLARRGATGWNCYQSGRALDRAAECVGLCLGIVWGPL